MSHGKRIRLKNYVKFKKTDILSIIDVLFSIRRIFVFLIIMNEPTDKHQDAEMFCKSDRFAKSKYDTSYDFN